MRKQLVGAAVVAFAATAANAIPPTQLVVSGQERIMSWDFPGPGSPHTVALESQGSYLALATDSLGNLYGGYAVSGTTTTVRKFATGTGPALGVFLTAPSPGHIEDLAFTDSDELLALHSATGASNVLGYTSSGALIGTLLTAPADEFYSAVGVSKDGRGFAARFNKTTRATVIDIFAPLTGASLGTIATPVLNAVIDLDFAADGTMYYTYSQTSQVYRVAPAAGALSSVAFSAGFSTAMRIGPDGNMYFAQGQSIRVYSTTGTAMGRFAQFPITTVLGDIAFGNVIPSPGCAGPMAAAGVMSLRRRRG